MNKTFSLIGLYLGTGLMLCGIIFSLIITPISIEIGDLKLDDYISPFINLLGAFIVYFSFKEQRKANQIQIDALAEDRARANSLNKFNQLVNLMNDIESIAMEFTVHTETKVDGGILKISKGLEAFMAFSSKVYLLRKDRVSPPLIDKEVNEYLSWLRIVLFTAKGVSAYPNAQDHSQKVLQMKFLNFIFKYIQSIETICKNAYVPSNDKLVPREIVIISVETVSIIRALQKNAVITDQRQTINW